MGAFDGKVALVSGAASGIGRASALRFLAEGAAVVGTDLNSETLGQLADEAASDRLLTRVGDAADEAAVAGAVAAAVESFGRLDIVFNNAGFGGAIGPITDIHVEDWDVTFAVLCRGVFLGTKHGAKQMIAQGDGGAIVNTASVAGLGAGCGPVAYSAAKAAVVNMTKTTGAELARHHIRVNAICPGGINTPLLNMGNPEALEPALAKAQPWPEAGTPDHIAAAAVWLASEEARFVTTEALVVDGGLVGAGPGLFRSLEMDQVINSQAGITYGSTGKGIHLHAD